MIEDRSRAKGGKARAGLPNELLCGSALDHAQEQLAAIVTGSLDAILTKNLDGIITSWNQGAESIFGYTAEEAIGEPITLLIPPDRQEEEPRILARIRQGERVGHFETIRRRKDGKDIHISLTVSPLRDREGNVIGASKIARDITEQVIAQQRERLLLQEMQHRIKNVFAVADSLIGICSSRTDTPAKLAAMVRGRLQALARAHALTVPIGDEAEVNATNFSLHSLIVALVEPSIGDRTECMILSGVDIPLSPNCVTPLALVLNELITNATKYGAWKNENGRVTIECARNSGRVVIKWTEHSDDAPTHKPAASGFGTWISETAVRTQLGGEIERSWGDHGLILTLKLDPALVELDDAR